MDIGVFPNSLEYWGPNAMVFFRNVQLRWMPIQGDTRATIALERPGASGDAGAFRSGVEAEGVQSKFPVPDLSGEFHLGQPWGYVELAGIVRYIEWEDLVSNNVDLSGDAMGWGLNLSTNLNTGELGTVRAQVVYGEAIQNYMNDAPVDIAVIETDDPLRPLDGQALPMLGILAFYDLNWSKRWTSSIGYSYLDVDNVVGQDASSFSKGHYALVNLLHNVTDNVMVGIEGQYGKRENFNDNFTSDDFRVQFSAKYNFSSKIGG